MLSSISVLPRYWQMTASMGAALLGDSLCNYIGNFCTETFCVCNARVVEYRQVMYWGLTVGSIAK